MFGTLVEPVATAESVDRRTDAGAAGGLSPVPVPACLDELAPGPELAAVLAGIEVAAVSGFDAVRVLRAEYRQAAHARARLLHAAWEVALREYGSQDSVERMDLPDEFSADEIRAALGLTRRGAETLLNQAFEVIHSRPALHPAMLAGQLDEPRARVFVNWTGELSDEHAADVCEELLPRCAPVPPGSEREQLTTAQLVDEIKKIAIALDPEWAQRRYVEALKRRRVVGSRNPDGTATLTGQQLPIDRVAAACGRLDALAKTAKTDGDPRPIAHLRAELFLGMTDGTYQGLTDTQILRALAATRPAPGEADEVFRGPAAAGTESASTEPASTEPEDTELVGAVQNGQSEPAAPPGSQPVSCPVPSWAGVELRVRLSTLLGLDRHPPRSPAGGRSMPNWPANSPATSARRSGATPSPTNAGCSAAPGSPPPAPPGSRYGPRTTKLSSRCRSPPRCWPH